MPKEAVSLFRPIKSKGSAPRPSLKFGQAVILFASCKLSLPFAPAKVADHGATFAGAKGDEMWRYGTARAMTCCARRASVAWIKSEGIFCPLVR